MISGWCLLSYSYVYVTAVNLMSTTATAEAMTDSECSNRFNVISGPKHMKVSVSSIDDTLLSERKSYYKGLYVLLLVAFFITLLIFSL